MHMYKAGLVVVGALYLGIAALPLAQYNVHSPPSIRTHCMLGILSFLHSGSLAFEQILWPIFRRKKGDRINECEEATVQE